MPVTHACPKCNRQLAAAGEVTVPEGGPPLPVFQCGECIDTWTIDGETFEHALTFAVDAAGRVVSPDTLEPLNLSN